MWRVTRRPGTGRRTGPAPSAGSSIDPSTGLSTGSSAGPPTSPSTGRCVRPGGSSGAVTRVSRGCRTVLSAAAALCVVAVLPGAAAAEDGTPNPYAYEAGARKVDGGGTADAAGQIAPGATYRSTIGPEGGSQGTLYYRVQLDGTDNVYLSVTAVPRLGTEVAYGDGIKVTLRDADGYTCSTAQAQFGPGESPRPVSALATRLMGKDGSGYCRQAGTYYLLVERDTDTDSLDEWGLEIRGVTEPALRTPEPATGPGAWDTSSPRPPAGEAQERHGGSSFGTAARLDQGAWRDRIEPGETLFYRVPVDWGQQVFARAELTGAPGGSGGGSGGGHFVGAALGMALYNPVRGLVEETDTGYQGEPTSTALHPLPPVAYRNRHAADTHVAALRLGGSYYLAVSLNPRVAGEFGGGAYGVTLDVTVRGAARQSPDYAGEPRPVGAFVVTPVDQRTAEGTAAPGAPARNGALQVVGVAALATGTLLVLVLAGWTLLARRHAAALDAAASDGVEDPDCTGSGGPGPDGTGFSGAEYADGTGFSGAEYADGTGFGGHRSADAGLGGVEYAGGAAQEWSGYGGGAAQERPAYGGGADHADHGGVAGSGGDTDRGASGAYGAPWSWRP